MFEGIRRRINEFVSGITNALTAKPAPEAAQPTPAPPTPAPSAPPVPPTPAPAPPLPAPEAVPGVVERLKALVAGEVFLTEGALADFWPRLEVALLESDVSRSATNEIISGLKQRLVGKRLPRDEVKKFVLKEVKETLGALLARPAPDLLSIVESNRPAVLLFLGLNGGGKTLCVAKLAAYLKSAGYSCVVAASDCWRAGAIEQLKVHCDAIGVPMISRGYGVDPTSVAYDAIAYARAHGIDVVLIDTAGRQETSMSLVREMQKMARVLKPHLKYFVCEAIAGRVASEQAKAFNEAIGIDAIILTKVDCDVKGGAAISIACDLGLPIAFVCHGQSYRDITRFNADWLIERVVGGAT